MTPALDAIVARARAASPRCGATTVIAIDGRAGSGKSTLATALSEALGCPVVRLEQVYPGWDGLAAGVESLVDDVLAPLADGRAVAVPHYDWVDARWAEPDPLDPPGLLVVEGVGAGSSRPAAFASVVVWLELDPETRRERALARPADGAAFAPQWERWAAQEEALFSGDDVVARADLVVGTSEGARVLREGAA